MLFKLFIILAIVVAILLILIVLVQNSKGGGLSSQFGGSGASQVIGVKKTTDLLEKVTWVMAILLLALSMSSSLMIPGGGVPDNANLDKAQQDMQQQIQQNQAVPPAITSPADSTGLTPIPLDTTQNQ